MIYTFTVSPNLTPDTIPGWFIFNTWMQRRLAESIHLRLFDDVPSQQQAIREDRVDLIYADAFDTRALMRERGFVPLARPLLECEEWVLVVHRHEPAWSKQDDQPVIRVATAMDPDVNTLCRFIRKARSLGGAHCIRWQGKDDHRLVAEEVLCGAADLGFIPQASFARFSRRLRVRLRSLPIGSIRRPLHALLAGPRLSSRQEHIQSLLLNMAEDPTGPGVLRSLGFRAWNLAEQSEMQAVVDLRYLLESAPPAA